MEVCDEDNPNVRVNKRTANWADTESPDEHCQFLQRIEKDRQVRRLELQDKLTKNLDRSRNEEVTEKLQSDMEEIFSELQKLHVAISTILPMSWAGDPCPAKADLKSCTCHPSVKEEFPATLPTALTDSPTTVILPFLTGHKTNSSRTVVQCNSSSSLLELEEIITLAFHRKSVDKLILSHVPSKKEHTLVKLPSGWLKNTRVKVFEIHHTILSGDFIWNGNPFEGQEQSLLWMVANNCHLYGALTQDTQDTVNTKDLNKLTYLEGLDLSHNHLTIVKSIAFQSPPRNLTTLILTHNSLRSIETGAFQYISKLKHVNMSHNLLEVVNRNMFPSSAKLETIDLSWNLLKVIPSEFFTNMPDLKTINLAQNFLYSMPQQPWNSVWKKLEYIDVTGNFINCDCDLLWLLPYVSCTELSHQTILGQCTEDRFPTEYNARHELSTLTRKKLLC